MEAVLVEFKARVAKAKAEFKTKSKEEKKELRTLRKATNQYVEKVTKEWRTEKAEEKKREKQAIRDSLAEWAGLVIDVWDTRNPPSNIYQMEAAAELPYSKKRWLHLK
jgi:hypothetical protein